MTMSMPLCELLTMLQWVTAVRCNWLVSTADTDKSATRVTDISKNQKIRFCYFKWWWYVLQLDGWPVHAVLISCYFSTFPAWWLLLSTRLRMADVWSVLRSVPINEHINLFFSQGRKEMFYLMMHSAHFIYGYMVSNIWWRTMQTGREEIHCHHYIGYTFWLKQGFFYMHHPRQDSTYNSLC